MNPEKFYNLSYLIDRSGGARGIRETVNLMYKLINKYKVNLNIRRLAIEIARGVKGDLKKSDRIFKWIRKHIEYVKDVNQVETIQTPIQTLKIRAGDCDDLSILAGALLESIGIPIEIVTAGYGKPPRDKHVFILIRIKGKRVPFDVTMFNRIGKHSRRASRFKIFEKRGF